MSIFKVNTNQNVSLSIREVKKYIMSCLAFEKLVFFLNISSIPATACLCCYALLGFKASLINTFILTMYQMPEWALKVVVTNPQRRIIASAVSSLTDAFLGKKTLSQQPASPI